MATTHPYSSAAHAIDAALTRYHGQPAGVASSYAKALRDETGLPVLRVYPGRHGAAGAAEETIRGADNVLRVRDYYASGGKPRISVVSYLDSIQASA